MKERQWADLWDADGDPRLNTGVPPVARVYDFMLGEGQALMAGMGHVVSTRRMAPELSGLKLTFIDPAAVIADYDRWTKIFEDTIQGRP